MASDKQTNLGYIIILLLFANTLFLGGIFFKLCCSSSMAKICPMSSAGKMCPFSKGSAGGSPKGSM